MFYKLVTYIKSPSFVKRENFYKRIYPSYFLFKFFSLFFKISLSKDWLVKDDKLSLFYYLNSDIGRYLFTEGKFELKELNLIFTFLSKSENPIFIDIGANIGYHSVMLSRKIDNLKIFAFEPGYEARRLLELNKTLNGLDNNKFVISPNGIGESTTNLEFFESDDNAYSSILKPTRKGVKKSYEIQVQSFDDWFETAKLRTVDFIKVDVEGYELEVVKGMKNTIENIKPKIFIEIYVGNSDFNNCLECFNLLINSGYKSFIVSADNTLEEVYEFDEKHYNYFFI